jgi:hypothetical protein
MRLQTACATAGLPAALLIAGCSYLHGTFDQSVDPNTSDHIHASVPIGTSMGDAGATLSAEGFNCEMRTGNFTDEQGHSRTASSFLSCVQRAGKYSFACENRDQVVVVPSGGVVDEVAVVRGPDCDRTPGPSLTPLNAEPDLH